MYVTVFVLRREGTLKQNLHTTFDVLLTVHLSIFISYLTNLVHKILFYNKFISFLYMFRAHVFIVRRSKLLLYSLWYQHTYRWPFREQVERVLVLFQPVHETATYRCYDTWGCVMQFWPPDDEHMCSKYVEAWNKHIVKQKCFAPSWLVTETNYIPIDFINYRN